MLQLLNAPAPSSALFSPEEEQYFTNTLQSTRINLWELHAEILDMEQELLESQHDYWDDYRSHWSGLHEAQQRLTDHKQPYNRRFRKLKNKKFLPLRRYGNSFDGWEKRRNDSPNMFKTYRDASSALQKQELTEPSRVLKHSTLKAAKNELQALGYVFNWRKTTDIHLAKNNKYQHALCEPETDFWAYSDNPYGKHGIEPSWRKIVTHQPGSYPLMQRERTEQRKPIGLEKQFVYDWKTGTYGLPTPSKPTAKSSRITVQARGCGSGGIRTMHNQPNKE